MSLAQKLKELETENAGLKEAAATACKSFAEVEVKLDELIKAHDAKLAETIAASDAKFAEVSAKLETVTNENAELLKAHELTKASLKSAEEKLGNPAFEHAVAGNKPVTESAPAELAISDEDFVAAYMSERDPVKKNEMFMARMGTVKM